jgi:penicillin V acylase-like amidase (Ntn superfamily)
MVDPRLRVQRFRRSVFALLVVMALFQGVFAAPFAGACTRVVFLGANGEVITARSMDWKVDIGTNLWIFPRGIQRSGEAGPNSVKWTSRYGSLIASGYDVSTTDGMNEKGLVANLLWLAESEYPTLHATKPGLALSLWAQYVLDNFATVQEAVEALSPEPFTVVTANVPGEERMATVHLSISDATGDSAIIEYVAGKQVIHHDRKYQVMTNSPIFEKQLAMEEYWQEIGGTTFLPGTNRAADRFARAAFYINAIPKDQSPDLAVASVFSVIRNASVPYGITTPGQPNISSTRWRTVADQKRLVYFFESAITPNVFWVDMKGLDFSEHGQVMKLDLGKEQSNVFAGNAAKDFKATQPFRFLGLP